MSDWPDEIGIGDFAVHMFRLQDLAGLTFEQAYASLTPAGYTDRLAAKWGISPQSVHDLRREGVDKARASGIDQDELIPSRFYHSF